MRRLRVVFEETADGSARFSLPSSATKGQDASCVSLRAQWPFAPVRCVELAERGLAVAVPQRALGLLEDVQLAAQRRNGLVPGLPRRWRH